MNRIEYQGKTYERGLVWDGTDYVEAWVPEQYASPGQDVPIETLVAKGTILDRSGEPVPEASLQHVKDRLLGTYDLPEWTRYDLRHTGPSRRGEPRRFLIPGLWPWETIPLLSGNQKAGKTRLVAGELVPSLLVPGWRFLDHFEEADFSVDDLDRGVWLINAETPAEDFEKVLEPVWGAESRFVIESSPTKGEVYAPAASFLTLWHLEEHGGPQTFDLTDPEVYDLWAFRLAECSVCDGTDDFGPSVVILDGLTAVLGGSTQRYAEWYAAFRRLMRSADVPNALVVAHATMAGNHSMGGVEMLGGPDGLWSFSTDDADTPNSTRRFSVVPRVGGVVVPRTVVRLDEDGRLRMDGSLKAATAAVSEEPDDGAAAEAEVLADLVEAGDAGLTTTEVTGGGGEVGVRRRKARDRLADRGEVTSRADGKSTRWWASQFAPSDT
jgi:hypothetical protein